MTLDEVRGRLRGMADPRKAEILRGFFRTGPGEYGEGDLFLGVAVPQQRALAREARGLPRRTTLSLLRSGIHEERLLALLLLVDAYARGDGRARQEIFGLYLENAHHVNNWDLVDLSAPQILGAHLEGGEARLLDRLARSGSLWERRMAIVATLRFTRSGDFAPALRIAGILLGDREDLIHKASGWMLREVGKRDRNALEAFLDSHAAEMPRTMLRYAVERLPEAVRRRYMEKRKENLKRRIP